MRASRHAETGKKITSPQNVSTTTKFSPSS